MTKIEEIYRNYEIGQEIVNELFKLSDLEIKQKLISILGNSYKCIIESNYTCRRIIENSVPFSIEIYCHDSIRIDSYGIHKKNEHDYEKVIVKFDQHFKL